jgi:hypothetical protein
MGGNQMKDDDRDSCAHSLHVVVDRPHGALESISSFFVNLEWVDREAVEILRKGKLPDPRVLTRDEDGRGRGGGSPRRILP